MDFTRREELRTAFDETAHLYHRARSRYPAALFEDIFEITDLRPPARLFEIGPGTGIATEVFAELGYRIVGVEPGEEMAKQARHNLEDFDAVEIVTTRFECYEPAATFDAALAFSAFHWIDPVIRYQQAASLLNEAGFLIVADARYVTSEDTEPLRADLDRLHAQVLGEGANQPGAPGLTALRDQMNESGVFDHIAERRYRWDVTYTSGSYIDLLETLPWYRTLEPSQREELYGRIRSLIDDQPTETVTTTLEAVLDVAKKTSARNTRPH